MPKPSEASPSALRLGMVGLSGYARSITSLMLQSTEALETPVRVVAAAGPEAHSDPERVEQLTGAGVRVYDDLEKMLDAGGLDAVWIFTPIHLHEPMTRRCLEAGLHVMCEKPAAGSVAEVESMIAARDAADRVALVGFQDVYDPLVLSLKRRLLAGEFGTINRVTLHASWPRDDAYFNRNNWAGRLTAKGRPVYDSPLNNALSHFAHQCLFLAGRAMDANADPVKVDAELYRAADIESFDTVTLHAETDADVPINIAMTHAAGETRHPVITLECEKGRVVRLHQAVEYHREGEPVSREDNQREKRLPVAEHLARRARGIDVGDAPGARLEMALTHTRLVEAVHAAAPIVPVPEADFARVALSEAGHVHAVPGIEDAMQAAAHATGSLHALDRFDWTRPAGAWHAEALA